MYYLDTMYLIAFAILCSLLALLAHEMKHIAVARRYGSVSLNLLSIFPTFRVHVSVPSEDSKRGTQFMAAAPLIFGVGIAAVGVFSVICQQIQSMSRIKLKRF